MLLMFGSRGDCVLWTGKTEASGRLIVVMCSIVWIMCWALSLVIIWIVMVWFRAFSVSIGSCRNDHNVLTSSVRIHCGLLSVIDALSHICTHSYSIRKGWVIDPAYTVHTPYDNVHTVAGFLVCWHQIAIFYLELSTHLMCVVYFCLWHFQQFFKLLNAQLCFLLQYLYNLWLLPANFSYRRGTVTDWEERRRGWCWNAAQTARFYSQTNR